ncbi:hypothetical protein K435DRAFT_787652 [Dendrothele bispora CBS 962.96]|uniref:Uncharacterized protein n=1 Tax=Dendrothele bispora (strain CBS 962.96) TaxID=1314807 RepID=A0A4S8MXH8_DENBC|nr:hypothetical protein K435DRAFT_787652 [Dendrothele bispora CBS 962.96]
MMLFLSLSYLVMNIEFAIIQIPTIGYNPPDSKEVIPLITGLTIGHNLMTRLNYVMGDIVVVWRAWVLFPQSLAVKVTLSICLLGSFVGASVDMGVLAKRVIENFNDTGSKTTFITLAVSLIFTNFTATVLIGFKAWHYFQSIRRNLGSTTGSPGKVLKILLLLMESGLLYLAFWIGYLVLGLTQGGGSIAGQAYLVVMPGLVAIYPILIILAVAHENNKPEIRASKSEVHHSESGGESQVAFPAASINNSTEVKGNEIEIVPRLS